MNPWGPNKIERTILDNVEKHGWFCMSVLGEGEAPPFAYSVGFTKTFGCPEFIVFGLNDKISHSILWNAFHKLKEGETPSDNQSWAGLIKNYTCVLRAVHPSNVVRDYLNSAIWFWGDPKERGRALEAFQIVWPDASGLFPWDSNCNSSDRDRQTPLWLPSQ